MFVCDGGAFLGGVCMEERWVYIYVCGMCVCGGDMCMCGVCTHISIRVNVCCICCIYTRHRNFRLSHYPLSHEFFNPSLSYHLSISLTLFHSFTPSPTLPYPLPLYHSPLYPLPLPHPLTFPSCPIPLVPLSFSHYSPSPRRPLAHP